MPFFNNLKRNDINKNNVHPNKATVTNNSALNSSEDGFCISGEFADAPKEDHSKNNNNKTTNTEEQNQKLEIANAETKAVRCLKLVVLALLLIIGCVVAYSVYRYTNNEEMEEFHQQFAYQSQQIIAKLQVNAQSKMEAIGSLALQVQAHAITMKDVWPFVTVPFFEEHVMATKSSLNAYGVTLFPIVNASDRKQWENYTIQHRDWVNASYDAQVNEYGTADGKPILGTYGDNWFDELWGPDMRSDKMPDFEVGGGIASSIFETVYPDPDKYNPQTKPYDDSTGTYFPQWQAAPLDSFYQYSVNLDYGEFDDFYNSTIISIETGTAVLGIAWSEGGDLGYITTLLYPIFNSFDTDTKQVVAFLGVDMFWETYLEGILPPQSKKIYVVVESTCDDMTFTFELIGDDAHYSDKGDKHESVAHFDDMVVSTRFGEHLQEPIRTANYAGTPLYDGFCQYDFHIYPSSEMEAQFMTDKPRAYTITICAIFFFTICIFLLYDYLVERRQNLVMKSASLSDSILSSLFPSKVKKQLYSEKQQEKASNSNQHGGGGVEMNPDGNNTGTVGKAIAHNYPDTTVLFADIAGFTQWSSGRDPSDVFTLLETIYGAFDKVAVKLKVFKVETIGDCYVAVTGLPDPQPNHALIMTKFASKMLEAVKVEIKSLVFVLGSETLNLAMRVGLHSGPVIAGIIRGEKARFQLYGDTVNVAARMENGGDRSRIHVSQETADILIRAGKRRWITPREELIEVKGKGKMQTYWVEITESPAISDTTSQITDDDEEENDGKTPYMELESEADNVV